MKHTPLLSKKELAAALNRSPHYVDAMQRRGFRMIAGRTTLESALVYLTKNPKPMRRGPI